MKICVIGSEYFYHCVNEVNKHEIFKKTEIIYIKSPIHDSDYYALVEQLKNINPNAIVLGPYSYKKISTFINIPCYVMRPSIIDILALSKQIFDYSKACILLPKQESIDLSLLEECLNVKFKQLYYDTVEDLNIIISQIHTDGFDTVLGNNLVCDKAKLQGLRGLYYYGKDGTIESIHNAIQLALNIKKEEKHIDEIKTILANSVNAVISTNSKGIINYANSSAVKILKTPVKALYSKYISDYLPKDMVDAVINEGEYKNDISTEIQNIQIIGNLIPIIVNEEIVGACLIFDDTSKIIKYETLIRQEIKRRDFTTKYIFENIIGNSKGIKNSIEWAKRYSKSDSTVMITAETGTGKEVFAQSIHNMSPRNEFPFIAINCSAIPEALIESELFGYETGSFTGASAKGKQGLIELAHHGTIFLDDIDAIPLSFQAKILRVIQEKEIIKIGGNKTIPIDVRFIVATNRDLKELSGDGLFRSDLYYRLSVLKLTIPPLRVRKEDIIPLYRHYVYTLDATIYSYIEDSFEEIFEEATMHTYPGNVRELINIAERFVALTDISQIQDKNYLKRLLHICLDVSEEDVPRDNICIVHTGNYNQDLKNMEKEVLRYYVNHHRGNMIELSKKLGLGRTTLYSRLKEL